MTDAEKIVVLRKALKAALNEIGRQGEDGLYSLDRMYRSAAISYLKKALAETEEE